MEPSWPCLVPCCPHLPSGPHHPLGSAPWPSLSSLGALALITPEAFGVAISSAWNALVCTLHLVSSAYPSGPTKGHLFREAFPGFPLPLRHVAHLLAHGPILFSSRDLS